MSANKLTAAIAAVRNGHTVDTRTTAAEHLAALTEHMNPANVDDTTLQHMIALLDSPDESVRGSVAAAIGNLGPRAKSAGPKLIAVLPHDCLVIGLSSDGAIRLALKKIGVAAPPPKPC